MKIEAARRLKTNTNLDMVKTAVGVPLVGPIKTAHSTVFALEFKDYKKAVANMTAAFGEPKKSIHALTWSKDSLIAQLPVEPAKGFEIFLVIKE